MVPPTQVQIIKLLEDDAKTVLDSLKAATKKRILLPINDLGADGGQHWSLLAFSRDENMFSSFDSMHNSNTSSTSQLVISMKKALNVESAGFVQVRCLQQDNFYDCGIHVLANIENISHINSHITTKNKKHYRCKLRMRTAVQGFSETVSSRMNECLDQI